MVLQRGCGHGNDEDREVMAALGGILQRRDGDDFRGGGVHCSDDGWWWSTTCDEGGGVSRFHGVVVSRWRHNMVVTSVAFRRERREKKLVGDEDGTAEAERRLTALAALASRVSVEKVEKIMLMC
ncbi:hypothetical protein LR48_Vigan543s002600 [Vigna angularis]|uniref:Uncharacterized protein n=1 Tax=Phaseolus angularis TaxID=3914 RepID=A0A0L9TD49_PHAAN|nr:hypothetical protein LR48_Vigan543s002600 [Vigna angularis]